MKTINFSELVEAVKQVALEQGSNYFHVELHYATSETNVELGRISGIFFKAYTAKSGWVTAFTPKTLIYILKERGLSKGSIKPEEIEIEENLLANS